jgi:nicotinic acid mononucleotide adenylyltransferase
VARVSVPRLDLTSTELRRRAAGGEPLDFLVPTPAVRILRAHGLYRS